MKVILFSGKAQNGKDQAATFLKEIIETDNKKVLVMHYADLLKYLCKSVFKWDGQKDEKGRHTLQYVGTDVIRKQNPDYWVKFVSDFLKMFKMDWDYVLIPDCRFPNEVQRMIEDGWDTFAVRVTRTDFKSNLTEEQLLHISETALDNYQFDYYIDTISKLDVLKDKIEKMYEYIKAKDGD